FTIEIGIAGLLRKTVTRLAHRARHIAVAMRFPAVHNELVRCVRALQGHQNFNLCEQRFPSVKLRSND
ncbi:hypothetical protein, partial [Mesorhizobium sp. M7A.F.Ca.MR.176.00.0.0]|uniref:hypothetical protein n=1 Tax=Mesorhizobium sp. M7A.F.Ca.MR.176.00.0.0 TaxID=2496776 RepID=UPI001FE13CA1